MILSKWGLTLNTLGSFLLGLHILGQDRLKKIEEGCKNTTGRIINGIFTLIFGIVTQSRLKWQYNRWPGGPKKWATELKRRFTDGLSLPQNSRKTIQIPIIRQFILALILGFAVGGIFWLIATTILLPLTVLIKIFAFMQNRLRVTSFFGLVGIILLIVGFVLQFID